MIKKLSFILYFLPIFAIAQHTIKGTFSPAEEFKYAILYKVTPTSSIYIQNSEVNKEGHFTFKMDPTLTKGIYRIVYALPQEQNNFEVIYNSKENIELTFNTEIGIEFKESIENKLVSSYTKSMALVSQAIGNYFNQESNDKTALISIFKTQRETQANYEEAAKGTMALHLIKAGKPYIPNNFEDIKTYIQKLKNHFFDNVDFNNETLQSSNFLIEHIINYVFGMRSENEEDSITYKKNIDAVYLAMKDAKPIIKKTLLDLLWQQMADANFDDVANYVADKYLMEIGKALKDENLVNKLTLFKNLSIGSKAPEFEWDEEKKGIKTSKNLRELNTAEQYIIVFWSSTCSHCLSEIPQLQTFLKSLKKGKVQVIAFGLEDESKLWKKESVKYPEFIHVLGLGKWLNETAICYNVSATPTYFILGKDKTIIAKPLDFVALKKFIEE